MWDNFLAGENSIKMWKYDFCFMRKALFFLKIPKFLS